MSTAQESFVSRPHFQLITSRGLNEWMASVPLSLALTTYYVGGVFMLGTKSDRSASIHVSAFDRSMGIWCDGQTMWLVTQRMIWRFENDLASGKLDDVGYDRVFVPRCCHVTGEIDGHEIAVDEHRQPVIVNTAFSCIATVDDRLSFKPIWHPPFISQLTPEDRCHLSGLAMVDGQPKYVTMHARSDVADGWRDFRLAGGTIMDIQTNEIVAEGLSMPHSPRVHDGKLWVLNSGTGHLGFINKSNGSFEPVAFVSGYARGLSFYGSYAFVGLSKPRRENAFQGLPLVKNLSDRGAAAWCGLQVIDLASGAVIHWARIESTIEELFDLVVLPGIQRPKALSLTSSAYANRFCFMDQGKQHRWVSA